MHSENTAARSQTPSCHFCLQQGSRHAPGPVDGSCLRMEPTVAPFPKELGIDGAERTGARLPRQVYTEEIRHPCYSWTRWDWSPDSPCVREIRRECGCIQRWYYPEFPHPFNGNHVVKVRGQQYCEWDTVHQPAPAYNGHCARRRVSFGHHEERRALNGPEASRQSQPSPGKPHCNGLNSEQAAFFPTEVPSSKLGLQVNRPQRDIRTSRGGAGLENHGNPRKSQGTVREQIKQVVTELEEVLGGLKQVQLEMKEVVQQIDILTSNIDLGEEEPSASNGLKSGRTDVVALIHNTNGEEDTSTSGSSLTHSPVTVDVAHVHSPSPVRNHSSSSPPEQRDVSVQDKGKRVVKETQKTANGNCLPHRTARKGQLENHRPPIGPVASTNSKKTHRPPPYPQNGQVKTRTPPYPGKHKTLSSTVVD